MVKILPHGTGPSHMQVIPPEGSKKSNVAVQELRNVTSAIFMHTTRTHGSWICNIRIQAVARLPSSSESECQSRLWLVRQSVPVPQYNRVITGLQITIHDDDWMIYGVTQKDPAARKMLLVQFASREKSGRTSGCQKWKDRARTRKPQ